MGAETPKQYLELAGRPLIAHTLGVLAGIPAIARVFVVIAGDDAWWDRYDWHSLGDRLQVLRCGGPTRAESVTNGLRVMRQLVHEEDWVLVHDAARCCITPDLVEKLMTEVGDDPVGGLLAVPVADTLKRAHLLSDQEVRVATTVPRDALWQAQTPQMFRHGLLYEALEFAPAVTDEASAVEALGRHPRLVAGDATNLKVTYPLDLRLAEWILAGRSR